MKKVQVCERCGSADLLQDAYVHVNDQSDVRTFDDIVCNSCGGSTSTEEVEVPDTFDIYSDKVLP